VLNTVQKGNKRLHSDNSDLRDKDESVGRDMSRLKSQGSAHLAAPGSCQRGAMPYQMQLNLKTKSIVDRCFGLVFLLVGAPVLGLITFLIAMDALFAREPLCIWYGDPRLSGGRFFKMIKFRVIRTTALRRFQLTHPLTAVRMIEKEAENLTTVGRFLVRLQLHNLPQLVHLVRGEMSLVGPRPFSPAEWAEDVVVRISARTRLKAGFIGPYQARHGPAISGTIANRSDQDYLQHIREARAVNVIIRDFTIIGHAVWTLARRIG